MADQLNLMMKHVLPYIWTKHGLLKQMPAKTRSNEEIESLRRAVHVHTFVTCKEWEKYLRRHFLAMIQDQASFCRYTAFACYLEIETYKSDYDRFIRLIALVCYFALYCYANNEGAKTAYLIAEPLLEKFFSFEMSHLDADDTFWKELNYFIMRKGYFELHLEVDKMLYERQKKEEIVRLVLGSSVFTNPASAYVSSKKPIASMHDSELLSNIDARTVENHFLSHQLVCAMDNMVLRDLRKEKVYAQRKVPFSKKLETMLDVGKELRNVQLQTARFRNYLDMAKEDLEYSYTMKRRLLELSSMRDMDVQKVSDVLRRMQNPTIAVD